MADPAIFLVILVAFLVLTILGFFVGVEIAIFVGFGMFLMGIGFFQTKKLRIILLGIGIGLISFLVSGMVGIGQGVITAGTTIQIIGFFLMIYSQNLLRFKDREIFHEIFEKMTNENTSFHVQGAPIPKYWISGIWLIITGLFIQLTGMFLMF